MKNYLDITARLYARLAECFQCNIGGGALRTDPILVPIESYPWGIGRETKML